MKTKTMKKLIALPIADKPAAEVVAGSIIR